MRNHAPTVSHEEPDFVDEAPAARSLRSEHHDAAAADDDAMRSYLRQIGRVPLLQSREERALCERILVIRSGAPLASLDAPVSEDAVVGDILADASGVSPDAPLLVHDSGGRRWRRSSG